MKKNIFKVNRRCCVLLFAIGILAGTLIFTSPVSAVSFGELFGALVPPGAQPGDSIQTTPAAPAPGTGTPPPIPTLSPGAPLPSGAPSIPVGDCTEGLNRALNRLDVVQSQVIPVYQQASARTGVPWEIFAAIHYVETGGSFNPNGSLISGRPLGTPEPDQGGQVYHSLLDTALVAANVFKTNYGFQSGPFTDFRRLVSAFAGYNGTGNRQCNGAIPKPQTNYSGCPASFLNEDHLYPLACFDERHKDMWKIYCADHQECQNYDPNNPTHHKYSPSMVGALTIVAGLQTRYQATPIPPQEAAAPTETPAQTLRYFNQCDSAYQSTAFGTCLKDEETLPFLCAAGCVPTSVAQVVATYANASYTPDQAAQYLIGRQLLSCDGSSSEGQIEILDQYSGQIEHGPKTTLGGNLASDAQALKPFFDQGWTALARVEYGRTQNANLRGHYIWLTSIDANNDIWAYDPYFINPEIMGGNAQPPLNLNGLLRGQYPDRSFTSLDVSWYVLVRRKS